MNKLKESQKKLFGLLKNKIRKICFVSHVFACSQMNIGETYSVTQLLRP